MLFGPFGVRCTYITIILVVCCHAGNIMTISYIAGTTAGSVFAYVLDRIIHYEIGFSVSWAGSDYHKILAAGAAMVDPMDHFNSSYLQDIADSGNDTGSPPLQSTVARLGNLLLSAGINSTTTAFPG